MNKKELTEKLSEMIKEVYDKLQDRPHQYIVAYFRQDNDELIGYHASSFCQITKDILQGKRYAGEDCYPQLEVISKNLKYTLDEDHEGMFSELNNDVKEQFGGLKSSEVYIDAIYLTPGTPKLDRQPVIISNE